MNTSDAIQGMVKQIARRFQPTQIILFGSQARGDTNTNSDVDLLVVFPEVADKRKIAIEIRRSLSEFNIPKDILVTTPAEISQRGHLIGTLLHAALREGKMIYERP
jgi:predicted nucleotidyltransferase